MLSHYVLIMFFVQLKCVFAACAFHQMVSKADVNVLRAFFTLDLLCALCYRLSSKGDPALLLSSPDCEL